MSRDDVKGICNIVHSIIMQSEDSGRNPVLEVARYIYNNPLTEDDDYRYTDIERMRDIIASCVGEDFADEVMVEFNNMLADGFMDMYSELDMEDDLDEWIAYEFDEFDIYDDEEDYEPLDDPDEYDSDGDWEEVSLA